MECWLRVGERRRKGCGCGREEVFIQQLEEGSKARKRKERKKSYKFMYYQYPEGRNEKSKKAELWKLACLNERQERVQAHHNISTGLSVWQEMLVPAPGSTLDRL